MIDFAVGTGGASSFITFKIGSIASDFLID